jgi:hypothetical protein
MITETYPSTRKTSWSGRVFGPNKQTQMQAPVVLSPAAARPNANDKARAAQFKITAEEFVRRDLIVREMWVNTAFKAGDKARPMTEQGFAEYGWLDIKGVYKTYHDFSTTDGQDWPPDDRPLTITAMPSKKGKFEMILLHPSYLRPKGVIGSAC